MNYTKEELIGRTIITGLKDSMQFKYKIIEDNKLESLNKTYFGKQFYGYDINRINTNLLSGHWKLLPEEVMTYTTPKGIKYGVGTKFSYPHCNGETYIIEKIENSKVYISDIGERAYIKNQEWTQSTFETTIIEDIKVIIIQDYQQVDPSTIKFDFTNTKIRVNNPEESKWIQKVAFNSGWYWSNQNKQTASPQYTDNPALGFYINKTQGFYRMPQATFPREFDDKNSREITIEDILNSNQMKEVIEVGDVVKITKGWMINTTVKVNGIDKPYEGRTFVEFANGDTVHYPSEDIKLVSKANKQEIIGYELLKDLPGIPKGTKNKSISGAGQVLFESNDSQAAFSIINVKKDTTWFNPIYKSKDITLKFSKYNATLSKEHGLVFTDNERISWDDVKSLTAKLQTEAMPFGKVAKFDVSVSVTIKEVAVGCKTFNKKDIELVTKAVQELQ